MTPARRLDLIAAHFHVDVADIRSASLLRTHLRARRVAVYVLRMQHGLSWGEICHALAWKRTSRSAAQRLYVSAAAEPDPEVAAVLGVE